MRWSPVMLLVLWAEVCTFCPEPLCAGPATGGPGTLLAEACPSVLPPLTQRSPDRLTGSRKDLEGRSAVANWGHHTHGWHPGRRSWHRRPTVLGWAGTVARSGFPRTRSSASESSRQGGGPDIKGLPTGDAQDFSRQAYKRKLRRLWIRRRSQEEDGGISCQRRRPCGSDPARRPARNG
jgi:hypothetical protein